MTLAVFLTVLVAHGDEVNVAVAANFAAPMKRIVADFERDTGHKVQLSSGATGKFYAQIRNGAPFDVLLAADEETPAHLAQEGAAITGSRFTYAIGRLVLWSPRSDFVDVDGKVLQRGNFDHIAIANPRLAPYGMAAVEVLRSLGYYDALVPRIVEGENIAQAYQFVASGNAPLGFVALSQVMKDGRIREGSAWIVPETLHRPIRQDAILLGHGINNVAARTLLAYLRDNKARSVMQSFGYAW
ncbi:MAG TPA: molybdate ABC transporter substrate-binding protein [Rhodocyclaceae bacterium]|nr:molybdate ABC transporter substrate-binding protein [Rhodocyclaceae bacterium]